MAIDPGLLDYAGTDRQREILEALVREGSQAGAARALGLNGSRRVREVVENVKARAARQGYSPRHDMTHTVPDGYHVKGASTLYNADGDVVAQWVKSSIDREDLQEAYKEAMRAFYDDLPTLPTPKGPRRYDKDIIPWFQIGDAHLGVLAHDAETGANFDLKIAERELAGAFRILFDEASYCERCVINDLGDATHYENMAAITENSGHPLDADGRFPKMIGVYSRVMRHIIDMAFRKFRYVDVILNQGNHSRTNDLWMAELLRVAYGGTGRLNVLDNRSVFIPYRMGNTFVMVHHSDKTKPERLSQVMSHDFRQDWGETEFHYIDVGHLHHKLTVNEIGGCIIEMWNTLAAKDKFIHDHGFRSSQSITRVDRSKTYGEVGRRVLPIKEIRDRLSNVKGGEVYVPPERRSVFTV